MDPRDFYLQASEIANGKPSASFGKRAVDYRSSISRAYYATFNVAVQLLTSMNVSIPESGEAHMHVQRYLRYCGDQTIQAVGNQLSGLREMRNHADYHLHNKDAEDRRTALLYLAQAKVLINDLDACNCPSRRAKILAGIKAYKRRTNQP